MRVVLFVCCFTLGLTLMYISGQVPRAAEASDSSSGYAANSGDPFDRQPRVYRPVLRTGTSSTPGAALPTATDPGAADEPATKGDSSNAAKTESDGRNDADEAAQNAAVVLAELDEDPELEKERQALEAEDVPAPKAKAGEDHVVWIGEPEPRLDGGASKGKDLTYAWRQIDGPKPLAIMEPKQAVTSVRGLAGASSDWYEQLYEFELTVTDTQGRQAKDTVAWVVLPGPELAMQPAAQRSFALRDGYLLGTYTCEVRAEDPEAASIEISSPVALTLTQMTRGDYELVRRRSDGSVSYELFLYRGAGHSESFEFFVDTEERIPGVLQVRVTWPD